MAVDAATLGLFLGGIGVVQAHAAVPDISEWQGQLTSTEVQSLKSQADFVINRVQYGSSYEDLYHTSNESLYVKYGVPFGSYDYATFTSTATAKAEADKFYQRANKNTKFYVLDFETTSMSSAAANAAVKAWYTEMRSLTSKKLIFIRTSHLQPHTPTRHGKVLMPSGLQITLEADDFVLIVAIFQ